MGTRTTGRTLRAVATLVAAVAITGATAGITTVSDERALYGLEGPVELNWQPRELGGWPAPFLADNPGTSVNHRIGVEDDFRPGSFVATLSFWLLAVRLAGRAARAAWITVLVRSRRGRHRRAAAGAR